MKAPLCHTCWKQYDPPGLHDHVCPACRPADNPAATIARLTAELAEARAVIRKACVTARRGASLATAWLLNDYLTAIEQEKPA